MKDFVMNDVYSNVKFGGNLLEINYPKLTVIRGVDHTIYPILNYVSKFQ